MGVDGWRRKLKEGGNRSLCGIPIIPLQSSFELGPCFRRDEELGLVQKLFIGSQGPTLTMGPSVQAILLGALLL